MHSTRRNLHAEDFPLGRDEDGWPLCRICKSRVLTKRNTTCSTDCRNRVTFFCFVGVQKEHVWKRDKGICAACGCDANDWHMDHIIPVAKGGGVSPGMTIEEGMANLRTLCVPCHKARHAAKPKRGKQLELIA